MGQRIRIKLKSFDSRLIDMSARSIVETAKKTGSKVSGPIPLPTHIRKFTVKRSVHVNVTAREQFEMRSYQRLIDIYNVTSDTMASLSGIELASGVEIQVKQ